MRPRRLKLGTHVDNGWMYHVYQNHAAALIGPFIFLFSFLSNFQTLKFFVTLFTGTARPRIHTLMDSRQMYCVYRNKAAAAHSSLYFSFFFLSNFQTLTELPESACYCLFVPLFFNFLSNFQILNIFVTLFSGTVRPRRLKLGTHVDSGWMYRVYPNHAAALICPFCFSFFLSNFQALKIFV